MRILVDYDNIPNHIQTPGLVNVVDRIFVALQDHLGKDEQRLDIRLYGGWNEKQSITKKAQKLAGEIQGNFPKMLKNTSVDPAAAVTVNVTLAYALEALPRKLFQNTFRFRPPARRLICDPPSAAGCKETACPLWGISTFISTGSCPRLGCAVTYEQLMRSPGEQKMVDTMIVADMIHLTASEARLALVSSDDDVMPGVVSAMVKGCSVFHVETQTPGSNAAYLSGVPGNHTRVSIA